MKRKVILYISVSLDGYIADESGSIDWISGTDESYHGDYGYSEFIKNVDTVILGYNTYHQIVTELSPNDWVYKGLTSYVFTHREMEDTKEVRFLSENPKSLIHMLKRKEGKNIWICGGGSIIGQLMKEELIDEYHLTIIPKLLGKGIRLFEYNEKKVPLRLTSMRTENGVIDCIYEKWEREK